MSNADDEQTPVRIRRAPKFSVFIVLGAAIGIAIAVIVTPLFPVDPKIGLGPILGYTALVLGASGVLLGALVAIVIDRILSRRARTLTASVARLEPALPDDPEQSGGRPTGDVTD